MALAFFRLSMTDDGCQRIVDSSCAEAMINSFISHSKDDKHMKREDGLYLTHLLSAFTNLTFSDYSIAPLLGKGAIANFNKIIGEKYVGEIMREEHKQKIQELSLRVLGNMSLNHEGKQECIDSEVILNAWKYLDSTVYEERLNASLILMSCTIHLQGKQQYVMCENDVQDQLIVGANPLIIKKTIEKLQEK